ncbi:cadherin-like domain-containing protein, partial [Cognaticolwellia aestuarii]|uniref:cadherin-like domain-containing protein n=1 Tax=Cognaticolwellia aestuarii TaxID=329993 RepID=UPI0013DDEEEE
IGGVTYTIGSTAVLAEGELTLNADGSYSFVPNANYNGPVPVVTYTVLDGVGDATDSTLTISVTPVSDLLDDSEVVSVAEDTTATGNVLDNATSTDGPLSVTSFTVAGTTYAIGSTAVLAAGELTLNADGSYSFVPNANYNGSVPIVTYTVLDGVGDAIDSTLTISVTPVSDLLDDSEVVSVAEDTTATGNVLDNAT